MIQINLYQAAFRPVRVVLPVRRLLAGSAVFLCALLLFYAWEAWRLTQLRREATQLTGQALKLETRAHAGAVPRQADPGVLRLAESTEARLRNLQRALDALASGALGSDVGYSRQFRALARSRVEGAWLTRVEIGAAGHEMNLRGGALSGEASARLIASLRAEPLFVGLSFAALTLGPPAEKEVEKEAGKGLGKIADRMAGKASDKVSDKVGEKVDEKANFLEFVLSARQDQDKSGTNPLAVTRKSP